MTSQGLGKCLPENLDFSSVFLSLSDWKRGALRRETFVTKVRKGVGSHNKEDDVYKLLDSYPSLEMAI